MTSAVTGCTSISPLASLGGIPAGIRSSAVGSAVGLKICEITAEIKKYKSVIKKKRKKHDKIMLPGKAKLHAINALNF